MPRLNMSVTSPDDVCNQVRPRRLFSVCSHGRNGRRTPRKGVAEEANIGRTQWWRLVNKYIFCGVLYVYIHDSEFIYSKYFNCFLHTYNWSLWFNFKCVLSWTYKFLLIVQHVTCICLQELLREKTIVITVLNFTIISTSQIKDKSSHLSIQLFCIKYFSIIVYVANIIFYHLK